MAQQARQRVSSTAPQHRLEQRRRDSHAAAGRSPQVQGRPSSATTARRPGTCDGSVQGNPAAETRTSGLQIYPGLPAHAAGSWRTRGQLPRAQQARQRVISTAPQHRLEQRRRDGYAAAGRSPQVQGRPSSATTARRPGTCDGSVQGNPAAETRTSGLQIYPGLPAHAAGSWRTRGQQPRAQQARKRASTAAAARDDRCPGGACGCEGPRVDP